MRNKYAVEVVPTKWKLAGLYNSGLPDETIYRLLSSHLWQYSGAAGARRPCCSRTKNNVPLYFLHMEYDTHIPKAHPTCDFSNDHAAKKCPFHMNEKLAGRFSAHNNEDLQISYGCSLRGITIRTAPKLLRISPNAMSLFGLSLRFGRTAAVCATEWLKRLFSTNYFVPDINSSHVSMVAVIPGNLST